MIIIVNHRPGSSSQDSRRWSLEMSGEHWGDAIWLVWSHSHGNGSSVTSSAYLTTLLAVVVFSSQMQAERVACAGQKYGSCPALVACKWLQVDKENQNITSMRTFRWHTDTLQLHIASLEMDIVDCCPSKQNQLFTTKWSEQTRTYQ